MKDDDLIWAGNRAWRNMVQANNSAFECVKFTEMPKSIYLFRVKWDVLLHRSICKSIEFVEGNSSVAEWKRTTYTIILSKKVSFQFLTLNFTTWTETFKKDPRFDTTYASVRGDFTAVAILMRQKMLKKSPWVFVTTTSKKQHFAAFFTSPFFASTICFQAFFSFYLIFRSAKNHKSES